ncbi:MAG: methyltransferase domain-containing protein [Ectothiorhodospiraceae bacterium]|nr:methyltransferase domain-containing protein [Ectothiorhodospiraceae bacterium]MCH8504625.1 methyltransferase domain-containing protein [Ectothiorhodospiraceae bacterium]
MRDRERAAIALAFDQVVDDYEVAAVLDREVGVRLLERLELMRLQPELVLDVGAGTGASTIALRGHYRKARVVAVDLSSRMLERTRTRGSWRRPIPAVLADAGQLPVPDDSVDLLFSSATLQWSDDLPRLLDEFHRVLRPGGLLLFSTLGPDTLRELRACWHEGAARSLRSFTDMHDIGDAMVGAGFADPVMDMELFTLTYGSIGDLLADLWATSGGLLYGQGAVLLEPWPGLSEHYQAYRQRDGRLPATWEVLYGHAWASDRLPQRRDPTGAVSVSLDDFRRRVKG